MKESINALKITNNIENNLKIPARSHTSKKLALVNNASFSPKTVELELVFQ
jgi:hypothetical protein